MSHTWSDIHTHCSDYTLFLFLFSISPLPFLHFFPPFLYIPLMLNLVMVIRYFYSSWINSSTNFSDFSYFKISSLHLLIWKKQSIPTILGTYNISLFYFYPQQLFPYCFLSWVHVNWSLIWRIRNKYLHWEKLKKSLYQLLQ